MSHAIELLAPAGNAAALRAAVRGGADAVYLGLDSFNARRGADNFTLETLADACAYAHLRGVRVYVTFNTAVLPSEVARALETVRQAYRAGADAFIVQDIGIASEISRALPEARLHISTQMNTHNAAGIEAAARLGAQRVTLARELSVLEIAHLAEVADGYGMEVESFAHGALCACHSGQCFMSSLIGGRSANRGLCAQACRLPYTLHNVALRKNLPAPGEHLLSPQDLCAIDLLPELVEAGVTSFKIEGRLKDVNYIRNVVAFYRRATDEALAARPRLGRASVGESVPDFTPDTAKSFTRGESEYFFAGRCAGVASFDTPKAVGERIGRVVRVERGAFRLDAAEGRTLAAGDGICFVTPGGLVGTNVNAAEGGRIVPRRLEGIVPGAEVFRNYDRAFTLRVERSRTRRVIPVTAHAEVSAGELRLTYTDCEGMAASASRRVELGPAHDPEANAEALRRQAVRSGDTIFSVRGVEVRGAERFAPASLVAGLRREALGRLAEMRRARVPEHRILAEDPAARYPSECLTAEENVTNRLAEAFYRDHGVLRCERGLDLAPTTAGRTVLRSAYCIRREIGECLRENPRLRGGLWLERGRHRYRLDFDCRRCEMSLVDCTSDTDGTNLKPK